MQVCKLSKRFYEEIIFTNKIVSEITGKNLECEGLIVSDGGYGRYSFLPEQKIYSSKATTYGLESLFEKIYKQNRRVVGIWHSHGDFPVFHSYDDKKHLEEHIKPLIEKLENKYKDDFTINKGILESWRACYKINGTVEDLENKITSLVINSKGDLYAEDKIKFVTDSRIISKYDIVKQIGDNLEYNEKKLKDFPNYDLDKYDVKKKLLKIRLNKVIPKTSKIEKIINGKGRWENRYDKFNQEYQILWNSCDIHISMKQLEKGLENKKYLKNNHKDMYEDIKRKISTLKYRSLFKEIRKRRAKLSKKRSKAKEE